MRKAIHRNTTSAGAGPESSLPITVARFREVTGVSAVTVWRFEQRGILRTVRISGRKYITAAELAEFTRRLEAGEFAGDAIRPGTVRSRGTKALAITSQACEKAQQLRKGAR